MCECVRVCEREREREKACVSNSEKESVDVFEKDEI